MTNEVETAQQVFNLAQSPVKIIHSGIPLYSAMAASPECIIYYENKQLSVNGRQRGIQKSIEWTNNGGHVIDICWYKHSKFIILTKREFYLFNTNNVKCSLLNTLPKDDKISAYYRCASNGECVMLCYWHRGTTIEEWNLERCVKRWDSPKSCKQDESICCLRLSSYALALTIVNSDKQSRFELRQRETMSILHSINLAQPCYRFISTHDNHWLLVPYYSGRRQLILIDNTGRIVKEIQVPSSDKNDSNDELIWNIALISTDSPCLFVRYERTICCFNIQ